MHDEAWGEYGTGSDSGTTGVGLSRQLYDIWWREFNRELIARFGSQSGSGVYIYPRHICFDDEAGFPTDVANSTKCMDDKYRDAAQ